MHARIVVVYDDPEFLEVLASAFGRAGHEVVAFNDPVAALEGLQAAQPIEVLVTCAQFPPGKPDGIVLARMIRVKRPGTRVLFIALPEFRELAAGLGEFMELPVRVPEVVEAAERLLGLAKVRRETTAPVPSDVLPA